MFFFYYLPCEKQTPKQTVTYLSCADRILNTIQRHVVMPGREHWHIWRHLKHPALSFCYTLTYLWRRDPPREQTLTPQCHQIDIWSDLRHPYSFSLAKKSLHPPFYISPVSLRVAIRFIFTILIKKKKHHILYVGPSTATTKQLIGSNVSLSPSNAMLDTLCIDTLILTEISIQTWYKYTRISIIYLINLHTGRLVPCIWH